MPPPWPGSRRRRLAGIASRIRLVCLDVDGVMTDGGIILIGGDEDARRFDVRDGMGVKMARGAGLKTAIISGRIARCIRRRAAELGMDAVYEGCEHKGRALDRLLDEHALRPEEVAYVGDDLQDLPAMERVGLPIAVANARPEVMRQALHVTRALGGHGAVREAMEWMLDLRGELRSALRRLEVDD